MKRISVIMAFACVFLFLTGASAQSKVINGGVLNGKATSLPMPAYPDAAKTAGAEAMIAVDIETDENGMVISAKGDPYDQRKRKAEDGTDLEPTLADSALVQAAEEAALKATFAPTRLNGEPVRVKGRIVYNFMGSRVASGSGESKPSTVGTVSGGVLNGKAVSLPAPAYAPAARAVKAEGMVVVQVTIDETGNVIEAASVSGHPLLRASAEAAAREAKFSPTLLNGNPVKINGVITYSFALPKSTGQ